MTSRNPTLRVVLFALSLATLFAAQATLAAPRIVEERVKLQVPGPADQRLVRVAISGNTLLVVGRHDFGIVGRGGVSQQFAYLFERSSNMAPWEFGRMLYDTGVQMREWPSISVAIRDNVAAVQDTSLLIFEPGGSGWTQVARLDSPGSGALGQPRDTEIDAGTIVATGTLCQWRAYRKDATGTWQPVGNAPLDVFCNFVPEDVDISGSRIVMANPWDNYPGSTFKSRVRVYEGVSGGSPTTSIFSPVQPDVEFGSHVAVEGGTILAGDSSTSGVHVFTGSSATGWNYAANLAPADTYVLNGLGGNFSGLSTLDMRGGLIVAAYPGDSYRALSAGAIAVYQRRENGTFGESARLVASDGSRVQNLGVHAQIDGRTIAAAANDAVYIFELPDDLSQPFRIQDTFNSGNAANWTPQAGSSFSVVRSGASRVYRQSSISGRATSIRTNLDWRDQSIQADVRPTAFNDGECWFGLAVRYLDADNYYFVTVRNTNVIQLRKIVDGAVVTLASAPLPVMLGRNYRLNLEAVGTRIRAQVDGVLAVEATDSSLTQGSAGPIMFKTRGDYDNIVVSPSPLLAIMRDGFENHQPQLWTLLGFGDWDVVFDLPGQNYTFQQNKLTARARAVTGSNAKDQSVQVDARPTAFGSEPDRWFGLIARYVDDSNYYYVTARQENSLSLRKLVNGQVIDLGTVPLNVSVGESYTLRLEAIGSSLRAYVDDELRIERTDTSFATGRYGLITFRAAVEYDNFLATQQ